MTSRDLLLQLRGPRGGGLSGDEEDHRAQARGSFVLVALFLHIEAASSLLLLGTRGQRPACLRAAVTPSPSVKDGVPAGKAVLGEPVEGPEVQLAPWVWDGQPVLTRGSEGKANKGVFRGPLHAFSFVLPCRERQPPWALNPGQGARQPQRRGGLWGPKPEPG